MGSYVVLFTRYCIATFLSSFFATVSPGGDFTGTIDGLIFAAYPLGMACTSIFATEAIRRMGTRVSVYVGLVSTVILTLVFGLAPDMVPNWQPVGPDWGTSTSLKAIFFTSYFLNGLLGAFAETACLILVSARFSESSGAVMASVNTVCSLGCLLGPVVGGVLYDIPSDRAAQFRLPFLVCAAIPLALLPFIHLFIPQQYISGTEEPAASASATSGDGQQPLTAAAANGAGGGGGGAAANGAGGGGGGGGGGAACISGEAGASSVVPVWSSTSVPRDDSEASGFPLQVPPGPPSQRLSLSSGLGLLSIALSGAIVGTLDPTLGWRLRAPPFRCSTSTVSLFFFYSSLVYLLVSTPIGWLIDRMPKSPRLYKLITCSGFVALFLTFALLAPIGPAALGLASTDPIQTALNSLPVTAVAMGLKGVGSALSNNAIYPDLVLNLSEDPYTQATITAWWNAAYAVGWAAGPALGGFLYDTLQENTLCIGPQALPPHCPPGAARSNGSSPRASSYAPSEFGASFGPAIPTHAMHLALPMHLGNSSGYCFCNWQPQNGFDGFSTLTALFSLAFSVVLAVAICANVRNPPLRS